MLVALLFGDTRFRISSVAGEKVDMDMLDWECG